MENLMVYLAKATICLIAFSVFFRLLLMRETFFRFTRFTLISGLIVCTVLPFIKLKMSQSHALQQTVFQFEELLLPEKLKGPEARYVLPEDERVERANPEAAVSRHTTGVGIGRPVSPVTALTVIYWLGVGIMLLRLGASFISLYRLLGKSRRIEKE
ncbi:MAG: hypothetical protein VB075_00955, partial [Petrimonas sp.]|nr:hypothetical protein [Petrimonas sp.]